MNDRDSVSLQGRGFETLLPEGGLPFSDPAPTRPAAAPEDFISLTVAEAFEAVDWLGEGKNEEAIDLDSLTVGEFFERFRWGALA